MKKLLSSMFAVLFLAGVSVAQAEQPADGNMPPEPPQMGMDMGMHRPGPGKFDGKKMKKSFEEIAKEINLTNEQKQQIETMAKSDKEKRGEIRNQIREKSKLIDDELLKENYDMNVVSKLTSEIQALQGDMAKMNIDGKVQMRTILTYDQFKQIEQMRQKNRNKFMEKKDGVFVSSDTAKATAKAEKLEKQGKAKVEKAVNPKKNEKKSKSKKSKK